MRIEGVSELRNRTAWRAVAIAMLLSGCSTTPATPPDSVPVAGQIADRVGAIAVEEAYVDKGGVFLKYQGLVPDRMRPAQFYARVQWETERADDASEELLLALPLEFQVETEWSTKPDRLQSVSVYDGAQRKGTGNFSNFMTRTDPSATIPRAVHTLEK